MKPVKNRAFCPASQKQKTLFQTEGEALRYIRYNGDEIRQRRGYAPVRAYYCALCCGYHVTSNPSLSLGALKDGRDKAMLSSLEKTKKAAPVKPSVSPKAATSVLSSETSVRLNECRMLLSSGRLSEAQGKLEAVIKDIKTNLLVFRKWETGMALLERAQAFLGLIGRFRAIENDGEAKEAVLAEEARTPVDKLFHTMLRNDIFCHDIESKIAEAEEAIGKGETDRAVAVRQESFALLSKFKGAGAKSLKAGYIKRLEALDIDLESVHLQKRRAWEEEVYRTTVLKAIQRVELAQAALLRGQVSLGRNFLSDAESLTDALGEDSEEKATLLGAIASLSCRLCA